MTKTPPFREAGRCSFFSSGVQSSRMQLRQKPCRQSARNSSCHKQITDPFEQGGSVGGVGQSLLEGFEFRAMATPPQRINESVFLRRGEQKRTGGHERRAALSLSWHQWRAFVIPSVLKCSDQRQVQTGASGGYLSVLPKIDECWIQRRTLLHRCRL